MSLWINIFSSILLLWCTSYWLYKWSCHQHPSEVNSQSYPIQAQIDHATRKTLIGFFFFFQTRASSLGVSVNYCNMPASVMHIVLVDNWSQFGIHLRAETMQWLLGVGKFTTTPYSHSNGLEYQMRSLPSFDLQWKHPCALVISHVPTVHFHLYRWRHIPKK